VYTDEELRQPMYSQTGEFCEAVETLIEMHRSRLTNHLMTSLPTATLCDDNAVSTSCVSVAYVAIASIAHWLLTWDKFPFLRFSGEMFTG